MIRLMIAGIAQGYLGATVIEVIVIMVDLNIIVMRMRWGVGRGVLCLIMLCRVAYMILFLRVFIQYSSQGKFYLRFIKWKELIALI